MRTHALHFLAIGLTLAACDDTGGPSTGGTLVVSTSTAGNEPDPDGYLLTVDGVDSLVLAATGTAEIGLPAGQHTLQLLGVAEHCSVAPGTQLEVEVPSQDTTSVAFEISCPLTGARITTTTTGLDIDPDGYRIVVDGTDRGTIPANDTVLTRLEPGSRTIALTGLTPNCTVSGSGSQTVTIVVAEVAPIDFAVVCTATSGVIGVVISGSGVGAVHQAAVDGGTPFAVGPADRAYLAGVPAGDHVVSLSSPANCSVETDQQSVTVTAGSLVRDTVEVTFSITCVSVVGHFLYFATGGAHTCALASSVAYCWGRGESGQLGVPVPTTTCMTHAGPFPCSMVPVAVEGGLTFAVLAAGGAHTCGVSSGGSVYCWGSNGSGQLGDNSTTSRSAPVPVATGFKFVRIAAGGAHTCGLTSDGSAYCWGSNERGQLGDNSTTSRSAPVPVATGLKFVIFNAGAQHTCGLTSKGAAYCWGRNDRGQLGDGTTTDRSIPVAVTGGQIFQLIVAGGFDIGHTCALTGDVFGDDARVGVVFRGDAYCWGDNERGQLGIGSGGLGQEDLTPHPVPAPASGAVPFVALTAGGRHTCGLTDAGAAYCWGENERGQVGDGSTDDRLEPSPVAGGLAFGLIDAGFRHTCGRAGTGGELGSVYCWGSGDAGQLGTNSTSQSAVPTKVLGQP